MGTSSNSKANWQNQIDNLQAQINSLKAQNARDRESLKLNNSLRGSSSHGQSVKLLIKQRTEQIKNLQEHMKYLRHQKSLASKS